MPATAIQPKLSAGQARAIAAADVKVKQLEAQLEDAKLERRELFDRHVDRIPLSDKPEEAAKGIRVIVAGGYRIRVTPKTAGDRFSMTRYLEAGHKITAAMRDAITAGSSYLQWTIKDQRGPLKPGSVEPS